MSGFRAEFIIAHASYLINIATPDKELRDKSREALRIEIERCGLLGIGGLVLHPGSHRGAGTEKGIVTVSRSLDRVLTKTKKYGTKILLENTAGTGNILGSSFEELAAMRERSRHPDRIGFCFDTCHAFAAGHDFSTKRKYNAMWRRFDTIIGLENLGAIHLNDSKTSLGANRDRHANIGDGEIGVEPFGFLVNDRKLRNIPMILETPKGPGLEEDIEALALLRSLRK
jgi:deoxyribonuclease-4